MEDLAYPRGELTAALRCKLIASVITGFNKLSGLAAFLFRPCTVRSDKKTMRGHWADT
jgi:hypothetical protein